MHAATYAALADFGAALQGIRPEDFTDRNSFFRFGRDPHGIDILSDIPGVDLTRLGESALKPSLHRGRGRHPQSGSKPSAAPRKKLGTERP